jgi:phosphohistidine phosphatase
MLPDPRRTMHLVLMRHGEASPPRDGLSDHDRTLTDHGQSVARNVAEHLIDHIVGPVHAWVSSATRAQHTWRIVQHELQRTGLETHAELRHSLYDADPEHIISLIRRTPVEMGTCIVIGHAPGIAHATGDLLDNKLGATYADRLRLFTTATAAVLDLHPGKHPAPRLVTVVTP